MDIPSKLVSKGLLKMRASPKSISIVVPLFNEQEVLPLFYERTRKILDQLECPCEIVFVNDGSTDQTLSDLETLKSSDPDIFVISLSRNFGKEIALTAGLDHASGEVVIVIDADLQDPPELIPSMIGGWQEGYDVVYAVRTERDGESLTKRTTAGLFYKVISFMSKVRIPQNTGDFRLMSRRSVQALKQLREHHRFMKGLFSWIGFPSKPIYYSRERRQAGSTKWNYWRLWNFALEGITSFSIAPLKLATYLGLIIAAGAFSYGIYVIYKTLVFGDSVAGYPSLMVVVLFLGGVQLVSIGLIGEYLGRVFNEVKNRPLYLVDDLQPSSLSRPSWATDNCVRELTADDI